MDIFCQVIDNFGDIAVVWRLTRSLLEADPKIRVRLIVDDLTTFHALCPEVDPLIDQQLVLQKVLCARAGALDRLDFYRTDPADVLVEAFGVRTPEIYLAAFREAAGQKHKVILHLEYLTAEAWSEEYHLIPSPTGWPGVEKYFFVPGFRARSGGVIVEKAFVEKVARAGVLGSLEREAWRTEVLSRHGLFADARTKVATVFSYEHDYSHLWQDLAARNHPFLVLVFEGRQKEGALSSLAKLGGELGSNGHWKWKNLETVVIPFLPQEDYDDLLLAGDFHVVRGEESWMRAVLSGRAYLWHAYLQPEGWQRVKVDAFLDVLKPRFEAEGERGRAVFLLWAREFRTFNDRTANDLISASDEHYGVFFENQAFLETVFSKWAAEIAKTMDLTTRMLDFLRSFGL